uniref:Uncharacterized protein n=1 Tax=Oryza rufipogon TaxID=4529 RepID=A0A0E0NFW9_ORYRU
MLAGDESEDVAPLKIAVDVVPAGDEPEDAAPLLQIRGGRRGNCRGYRRQPSRRRRRVGRCVAISRLPRRLLRRGDKDEEEFHGTEKGSGRAGQAPAGCDEDMAMAATYTAVQAHVSIRDRGTAGSGEPFFFSSYRVTGNRAPTRPCRGTRAPTGHGPEDDKYYLLNFTIPVLAANAFHHSWTVKAMLHIISLICSSEIHVLFVYLCPVRRWKDITKPKTMLCKRIPPYTPHGLCELPSDSIMFVGSKVRALLLLCFIR